MATRESLSRPCLRGSSRRGRGARGSRGDGRRGRGPGGQLQDGGAGAVGGLCEGGLHGRDEARLLLRLRLLLGWRGAWLWGRGGRRRPHHVLRGV